MNQVAAILSDRLREDGIEVLAPRRAADDPHALVERFKNGGPAVLLGARKFWQGLDIPGVDLQAVVIVEGRTDKRYFARLAEALPPDCRVEAIDPDDLERIMSEVGIGTGSEAGNGSPNP